MLFAPATNKTPIDFEKLLALAVAGLVGVKGMVAGLLHPL